MLRIGIQRDHASPHPDEFRHQVSGDGGFAHSALPPCDGNDGHKEYYKGILRQRSRLLANSRQMTLADQARGFVGRDLDAVALEDDCQGVMVDVGHEVQVEQKFVV